MTLRNLDKAPFPWFGGKAHIGADGHQQHRERLWASPTCLPAHGERQLDLLTAAP